MKLFISCFYSESASLLAPLQAGSIQIAESMMLKKLHVEEKLDPPPQGVTTAQTNGHHPTEGQMLNHQAHSEALAPKAIRLSLSQILK